MQDRHPHELRARADDTGNFHDAVPFAKASEQKMELDLLIFQIAQKLERKIADATLLPDFFFEIGTRRLGQIVVAARSFAAMRSLE